MLKSKSHQLAHTHTHTHIANRFTPPVAKQEGQQYKAEINRGQCLSSKSKCAELKTELQYYCSLILQMLSGKSCVSVLTASACFREQRMTHRDRMNWIRLLLFTVCRHSLMQRWCLMLTGTVCRRLMTRPSGRGARATMSRAPANTPLSFGSVLDSPSEVTVKEVTCQDEIMRMRPGVSLRNWSLNPYLLPARLPFYALYTRPKHLFFCGNNMLEVIFTKTTSA